MPRLFLISLVVLPHLAAVMPQTQLWLRLSEAVANLQIDPRGRYLAYQAAGKNKLKVLNLQNKFVFTVTTSYVGGAFFWAPGGHRLFYRELELESKAAVGNARLLARSSHSGKVLAERERGKKPKIYSHIKVFDVAQGKSHLLESLPSSSGMLTFDPRDLTFQVMHDQGIKVNKIYYPSNRLAKWQVGRRTQGGKWLATQRGMLLVESDGRSYRKLADDDTGLVSFAIAPRGEAVLWGTRGGRIYLQRAGEEVSFIARGRDPSWHPQGQHFVYAKAIFVGRKLVDYDLRMRDYRGQERALTRTRAARERWPVWREGGQQILFTREKTMDIFALQLRSHTPKRVAGRERESRQRR